MKAIALLSGGIDSSVAAAVAKDDGYEVHALAVDYGQRHRRELNSSRAVAEAMGLASFREVKIALPWGGASLIDSSVAVAKDRSRAERGEGLAPDYVPGRNTIFLALALSWADAVKADRLVVGWNAEDQAGFPDCTLAFADAFNDVAAEGTPTGPRVYAPLVTKDKAAIIAKGIELDVPLSMTWSCYDPRGDMHCARCDACKGRREGFAKAGYQDPRLYAEGDGGVD